jgi:hypothetical protein
VPIFISKGFVISEQIPLMDSDVSFGIGDGIADALSFAIMAFED